MDGSILAVDLGRFDSVEGRYELASRAGTFRTVAAA